MSISWLRLLIKDRWHFREALKRHAEEGSTKPPDFVTVQNEVLRENTPAPALVEMKDFFRFLHTSSRGMITKNGYLSIRSLYTNTKAFFHAFNKQIKTEIDEEQQKEIYHVYASFSLQANY